MSKALQIYYTAVLGALGGLLGWWLMGSLPTDALGIWAAYPLVGAGLGVAIAGCVAATEGALVKRRALRAMADMLRGALSGAALGLLGLVLAELGFLAIGGGFVGRTLGWMLLGLAIGLGEPLLSRRLRRAAHGAAGGAVGGAVGGALYEALTLLFLRQGEQVQMLAGGVGLMLLGACIGACIPLARYALASAELRVLSGAQAGLVREVTDTASIGRSDCCDLYLPDRRAAWNHARVRRTARGFSLEVLPEAEGGALLGGQVIYPGSSAPLADGAQITIGETTILFAGR